MNVAAGANAPAGCPAQPAMVGVSRRTIMADANTSAERLARPAMAGVSRRTIMAGANTSAERLAQPAMTGISRRTIMADANASAERLVRPAMTGVSRRTTRVGSNASAECLAQRPGGRQQSGKSGRKRPAICRRNGQPAGNRRQCARSQTVFALRGLRAIFADILLFSLIFPGYA